jgi:hypothetical protein
MSRKSDRAAEDQLIDSIDAMIKLLICTAIELRKVSTSPEVLSWIEHCQEAARDMAGLARMSKNNEQPDELCDLFLEMSRHYLDFADMMRQRLT